MRKALTKENGLRDMLAFVEKWLPSGVMESYTCLPPIDIYPEAERLEQLVDLSIGIMAKEFVEPDGANDEVCPGLMYRGNVLAY